MFLHLILIKYRGQGFRQSNYARRRITLLHVLNLSYVIPSDCNMLMFDSYFMKRHERVNLSIVESRIYIILNSRLQSINVLAKKIETRYWRREYYKIS